MGEAKRRRAEFDAWLSTLSGDEHKVFEVSYTAFDKIIIALKMTSGCYLISFFLAEYLRSNYGIAVNPVVGHVTDESDDLPISHAWVEFGGKIIDLTLFYTETQPRGPLIILNRVIKRGEIFYQYHHEMTMASRSSLVELLHTRPDAKTMIDHKDAEHAKVLAANTSSESRMAFLLDAPVDRNFEALSARLD